MTKDERDIPRKLKVMRHAGRTGDGATACRYFAIGLSCFYRWKSAYA